MIVLSVPRPRPPNSRGQSTQVQPPAASLAKPTEFPLPIRFVLLKSPCERRYRLRRRIGRQPSPELTTKGLVLGAIVEVHLSACLNPPTNSQCFLTRRRWLKVTVLRANG